MTRQHRYTFTARRAGRLLLVSMAMGALAPPAFAHIVLAEPTARPGSYYAAFFRVSHGCGDSPTVSLRVEIPAGINTARPQPKPGWTIQMERRPLAEPIRTEGGVLRDRVTAVTWRGRLEADQFDQFGIMLKLPATGAQLYFPTVQTCQAGERRWTQIPAAGAAWNSVPNPAPVLALQGSEPAPPPTQPGHGGHEGH